MIAVLRKDSGFCNRSYNLEGHGQIQSRGGNGYGGGAGGRIGVYLDTQLYYHGHMSAIGGAGTGHYLTHGGPGSVYIQDIRYVLFLCFVF